MLSKRNLYNALRIGICVAALWFVLRGVHWKDRVVLAEDGRELAGLVREEPDRVVVDLPDGERIVLPDEAIARDERGDPRISHGLYTTWRKSRAGVLLLAVLIHLPVGLFQAIRLQWLLGAQTIPLAYWECVKLSFAGNFLNFATPLGSNAGDVFKAYFVTTHTPLKTEAATTIALDRLIGLATLLLCVAVIVVAAGSESRLAIFRPYILGVLTVGLVGAVLYFSPIFGAILRRLPTERFLHWPVFQHLRRIDQTARELVRQPGILLGAFVFTVLLQVLAIGAYFAVAVALGLYAHVGNVLEYYAYFYTGAVIAACPGPPQGLGTVELAYRFFFAPFGSPSQIVSMALVLRMVVLIVALPGLLVTVTGSYRPRTALRAASSPDSPACPKTQSQGDFVV